MTCDAHIHVGYYYRHGHGDPFYYSPRRICTVLKKFGVDEFIYSSTSMQTWGVDYGGVHKEAMEVQRLFGKGAHPFLWISRGYLECDPLLSMLRGRLYEGIKLHGLELPWIIESETLERVLGVAEERGCPVMLHTGGGNANTLPQSWLPYALRHPCVRFDFAHGSPLSETEECLAAAENVFVDTACMTERDINRLVADGWADRILWGSDFPAIQSKEGVSLTSGMKRQITQYNHLGQKINFAGNFRRYLNGI